MAGVGEEQTSHNIRIPFIPYSISRCFVPSGLVPCTRQMISEVDEVTKDKGMGKRGIIQGNG
jgi:hypothetical protein